MSAGLRFDGSHDSVMRREITPETESEIESTIEQFLHAAMSLADEPREDLAEQIWDSSRRAWVLLLPHRRHFLASHRPSLERFRDGVREVRTSLENSPLVSEGLMVRLRQDLARRESLLVALLSPDGERRLRELLTAELTHAGLP